jgi:CBS domain containing-hemolysin-like protein
MTGALFILAVVTFAALVLVTSVTPVAPALSVFELTRRKDSRDHKTNRERLREQLHGDVVSIQRILQAILMVTFVLLIVAALGWLVGSIIAVIVALEYGVIARLPGLRRLSQRYYAKYEQALLLWLDTHRDILRWFRSAMPPRNELRVDSKDELVHIVTGSGNILSDSEIKLITASLSFDDKLVSEILTPKSVVETIKKGEVLGPLTLDELHKTGHSRFPVIDEDIDHIVGILYVKNVLTLDTSKKHTSKVESVMSKSVHYIRDDHTLSQALSAFLSTHSHLFIVINEFRETIGIITLEDTIEALLGRKIVDEFDAHDDMRAVAARQAAHHHAPSGSIDV